MAASVAGRRTQRRLTVPRREQANPLGRRVDACSIRRDGQYTGGQGCIGTGTRMVAGGPKIGAIRIALQIHHAALVDPMAVVPDPGSLMACARSATIVVTGLQRGESFAGVVMLAMRGVFRWRGGVNAGDLVGVILFVLVLGERGMTVRRLRIERVELGCLQRQVVMRRSHDR